MSISNLPHALLCLQSVALTQEEVDVTLDASHVVQVDAHQSVLKS